MRLQHKKCSIFEGTVKKGLILNIQNDIKIVMGFSYSKLKLKKNKKMKVLILGKNDFDEPYFIEPFIFFTTTNDNVYFFNDKALFSVPDSSITEIHEGMAKTDEKGPEYPIKIVSYKGPEHSVLQYYEGIPVPLSLSHVKNNNVIDLKKASSETPEFIVDYFDFLIHHYKDIYVYEKKLPPYQPKIESVKTIDGEIIKKEVAPKIKKVLSIDLPGIKPKGTKLVKSSIDEYEFYRNLANNLHHVNNKIHDPRLQDLEQLCNRNVEQLKPIVYIELQKKIVVNQVLLELLCLSGRAILLIIEKKMVE